MGRRESLYLGRAAPVVSQTTEWSDTVSRWDEGDLEQRLCRALDIAGKTVTAFGVHGYTDTETPVYSFGPEKPLAETAMLMYACAESAHRPAIAKRIGELAELVAPRARCERMMANIALNPALAFKFAAPHVLLTALGYADDTFDDFLKSCLASEASNGQERPPSARIERKWLTGVWTGEHAAADWSSELDGSVLGAPLDILGGLRNDAYAWTHLLMYSTDFGNRPRRLRRTAGLLRHGASLLVRYLDAEDYDLAGEILLAWPLTDSPWSPAAAFAFKVLAGVEDEVGTLPCGNMNLARLNALDGDDRFTYALGTAYHTAYVMGFLCAAAMRAGRRPPTTIVGPPCEWSALTDVLRYVDDTQGHWQAAFARLDDVEQRALTPFVLDVAIVQKSRRRDYAAIDALLSLARRHGMAGSSLCRQAADLLARLASCGTAIATRSAQRVAERREDAEAADCAQSPWTSTAAAGPASGLTSVKFSLN
jgi:hypothetical protein